MDADPTDTSRNYSVRATHAEYREIVKAAMRANWKTWVASSYRYALIGGALTTGVFFSGSIVSESAGLSGGFYVTAAIGLIGGACLPWLRASNRFDRAAHFVPEQVDCSLTEESWRFRRPSGVMTEIPWRAMRLSLELPNAWIVQYGSDKVIVYRRPLREAGLEAEFASHLGYAASAAKS